MITSEKLEELKSKFSSHYIDFYLTEISRQQRKNWYEKLCEFAGKILKIKYENKKLAEDIIFSNLNVLPNEVFSLTLLSFLFSFLFSFLLFSLEKDLGYFIFILPFAITYLIYTYPSFRAKVNRIQTNSEAIKIITYLVLYLETNPNFESAIDFAASKSKGILSDDLKKITWDLKTGRFYTLKDALEHYIPKWIKWNENFVRALILLSNVSYVKSSEERKNILRKTLDFILNKNFEETKIYVEQVRGPITLLFLFGLLMPSIGLILFPMISVFLHFSVKPSYLIFGYIFVLPLINFYLITRVISFRPGAFLIVDISRHPKLAPYNYFYFKNVLFPILPISLLIFLLISLYGFLHFIDFYTEFFKAQQISSKKAEELLKKENEIRIDNLLASFSITLGFGLSLFLYFYLNSFEKVKIRKEIKDIEEDLPNLYITSGNFLEAGNSIENTLEKTIEEYERMGMKGKSGYKFYLLILDKIKKFGESVENAIFGKDGVIHRFPSVLLEETLRVIIETARKSVSSAGTIAKTIARYLENIYQAEFRLKELLSDVRGNLKMQAQFLIPIITGIVSATGIFIINLLSYLAGFFQNLEKSFGISAGFSDILNVLVGDFNKVIPLTLLQAVVGVYTVEAIVLMSFLLSGIENGFDKIARDYEIAENLKFGLMIYFIFSILTLIVFNQILISIKVMK